MKKVLQLSGLDCAGCAAELEREIAKIEGVEAASVSFVNQKLTVEYRSDEVLEKILDKANHFEEVRVVFSAVGEEQISPLNRKKNCRLLQWLLIAVSAVFFTGGILFEYLVAGTLARVFCYIFYAIAYFSVGYPVLWATIKNIGKGKIFDENFLMTVASIGAVLLGEYFEGVAVMLLYQIGETLQSMAVNSSRKSVSELMDLKSEWATVLVSNECSCGCCCGHDHEHDHNHEHEHEHRHDHNDEHDHTHALSETQKRVRPEELQIGDVLLVKAGEKIPVDGVLLDKSAVLDTKSLTGESEHRTAREGDELLSGCINVGGVFKMRVLRQYNDSAVSRILDMVENAASGKAAPEKFITRFARYYTPVVCCFALALAIFAPLVEGAIFNGALHFRNFARWANSALTFLVVSCPCALIISVPLTYFSGIGTAAKQGVLVKGATYLDVLAKAKTVAFDKTGTLTEGNFTVCATYPENGTTATELLSVIAAVEKGAAHPIARAFSACETPYTAERVTEISGRGVSAVIGGERVLVGNLLLMQENGIAAPIRQSAYTLVYAAKSGVYLGAVEVGDMPRLEAADTVRTLQKLGVTRSVMLTGDHELRAKKIAEEVGITEVYAGLLPDGKLKKAEELKTVGGLIYVGDGVNDAPVMAASDCAVSMGTLGSAAAVEASDLVLISDNLQALVHGVKIARKTRFIVLQNIVFSILMKTAFMVLGALGVLPLWLAVFADVGVMLLAVLNSLRVRAKIK